MDARDAKFGLRDQALITQLDAMHTALRNVALTSAGLAISSAGAAKKKVKIANTVTYLSGGIFCSKTTAEIAFTDNSHDIAANASTVQEACYLLTLDSAGTGTLTMGAVATGSGEAKLPDVPSGGTPIGYVRVAVAAGATSFAATGDDLDAAHLTVAYYNLGGPIYPRFDAAQ